MSEVTIRSKTFYPAIPARPEVPAIEPCDDYPEGVPYEPAKPEIPCYWMVDAIVDTPSGTRSGTDCVPLGEDATDDDIIAFLLGAYNLTVPAPPENS